MMTPAKAEERIKKWAKLREFVDRNNWPNDTQLPEVIEMLLIAMELRESGYQVTDDGQWYHPSEAN